MTRRSLGEEHIRNLTAAAGGTSYSVTIPIEYIRKLKWRAKQKVEVTLHRNKIIIKDWKP